MAITVIYPDCMEEELFELHDIIDEFWNYINKSGAITIVWPSIKSKGRY